MPETRSIGEVLRDAELGRLENVFAENPEPYDLVGAADRLFDLLDERRVDYVLVGGMAMLQYVEGRNTRDIDLLFAPRDLAAVPELVVSSRDGDFARAQFERVQIASLLTTNKIFDEVRKRHSAPVQFGGREVVSATAQGMLILKLFALPSLYRQGDIVRASIYEADIAGLLAEGDVAPEAALGTLRIAMLPTDIDALRQTIADIAARGSQFDPSSDHSESETRNPKSRSCPSCSECPRRAADPHGLPRPARAPSL